MRKYVPFIIWTPMYYELYYIVYIVFIDIKMISIGLQYVKIKITYVYGHTTILYVTNACVTI